MAVVALGGWWGVREIDGMWKGRQQEKVGWWAGGGGGFRENDIVIHSTLCHKLGLKDAKTSSALSPVGEMAQFKQSKQLFYSDAHFSLAGG